MYESIPSEAYSIAENGEWKVYLNDEAIEDSIESLPPVKQVSLWAYNKNEKSAQKILLSHPHSRFKVTMEHSVKISLDSIPTISRVKILSWKGEPLKLLVEGSSDYRNVQSFIIGVDSIKATCLPTNRGLIGVTEEDGFLVMQSYEYYEEGGRYNIIEAFDVNGNRVSSMSVQKMK